MPKKLELAGQKIGRLVVIREYGRDKHGNVLWLCRCLGKTGDDCGNECVVSSADLKKQHTQSCGCLQRDRVRECSTIHGLNTKHKRLYDSIRSHFKWISEGCSGYQGWTIDTRYPNNAQGVANFCRDLIELQPKMSELYESDRSLDVDKDNGGKVFCPECIVFRKASENRSKQHNNLKLLDGTPFVEFCRKLGYKTRENGRKTSTYMKFADYFRRHNGGGASRTSQKSKRACRAILQMLEIIEVARRSPTACRASQSLSKV